MSEEVNILSKSVSDITWSRAVCTCSQWQEMSIVMESWNRNMKLG